MNTINLTELGLLYIPGSYSYNQGISGRKNFEHTRGNKHYNGCGGEQVFTSSKLNLYGVTDDNQEMGLSIKNDILKIFDRSKLNDSFVSKIQEKMPKTVEIEMDENGGCHLSKQSCLEIFKAIHPRKEPNI